MTRNRRLRACVAAALLTLAGAASSADALTPPYELVGRLGIVHYVVVPQSVQRERAYYDRVVEEVCAEAGRCFLRFFTNSRKVAVALPLPDEIQHEATVIYQRSDKRGGADFRWSCRLGVPASTCF